MGPVSRSPNSLCLAGRQKDWKVPSLMMPAVAAPAWLAGGGGGQMRRMGRPGLSAVSKSKEGGDCDV